MALTRAQTEKKRYIKRKSEGYRSYLIFDKPENIEAVKKFYHQLKGIPEKPIKPN